MRGVVINLKVCRMRIFGGFIGNNFAGVGSFSATRFKRSDCAQASRFFLASDLSNSLHRDHEIPALSMFSTFF